MPQQTPRRSRRLPVDTTRLLLLGGVFSLLMMCMCMLALLAGAGVVYGSGRVLPGVSAAGIDLGGKSEDEAATALDTGWNQSGVTLRDADRTWNAPASDLGLLLDTTATAAAAKDWGRSTGGISGAFDAILGSVALAPVLDVNLGQLTDYLENIRDQLETPARNAGVQLVNGQVVATDAVTGRVLDVAGTVERVRLDAADELADGALDLVMQAAYPTITDAAPLVDQANRLLASPFVVRGYDPVRDEWHTWSAPPEQWASWLEADSMGGAAENLQLAISLPAARTFLESNAQFGDERYIEPDDVGTEMQAALGRGETEVTTRVWHGPTQYTVRSGQTLAAIAEEVGIPYPYIQAENTGINTDALSVGQVLTLPSRDVLIPLPPVENKRIVISRGQQHMWAYENGQVVFDWVISTGISTSPTALGVFQVQSHETNAYADQWNLYMPHFIGFYHPGPNVDVMNGFHGFPTRSGGYLLWVNDLGRPATYGCVLLDLQNAEALFNWADLGVVVEVRS